MIYNSKYVAKHSIERTHPYREKKPVYHTLKGTVSPKNGKIKIKTFFASNELSKCSRCATCVKGV